MPFGHQVKKEILIAPDDKSHKNLLEKKGSSPLPNYGRYSFEYQHDVAHHSKFPPKNHQLLNPTPFFFLAFALAF